MTRQQTRSLPNQKGRILCQHSSFLTEKHCVCFSQVSFGSKYKLVPPDRLRANNQQPTTAAPIVSMSPREAVAASKSNLYRTLLPPFLIRSSSRKICTIFFSNVGDRNCLECPEQELSTTSTRATVASAAACSYPVGTGST
ncbi:unnamed protein product, partial [Ectocarpus sp. 8 AP-2014]